MTFARHAAIALALLSGCTEGGVPEGTEIVAIGDSMFEWHAEEGDSIPDVVGAELGVEVANLSESGTWFSDGAIPGQYVDGPWSWLVVDGGGNDLNDACECGDCDALMDELIDADGTGGLVPEFVGEVVDTGVRVAWMGYPELPADADHGFSSCMDELEILSDRLASMADTHPDVIFVDARDVVAPEDEALFDEDNVHPSVQGSEVMGRHIAEAIASAND